MKKIDRIVLRETLFVAAGSALLSILMNAVFLVIGKWDLTVLFGTLLGYAASVLNFFLMGITVQNSVGKEEKTIKTTVRFSMVFRELLMLGIAVAAYFLKGVFNIIPLLIAYFFPRIVVMFRPKFKLKGEDNDPGENNG